MGKDPKLSRSREETPNYLGGKGRAPDLQSREGPWKAPWAVGGRGRDVGGRGHAQRAPASAPGPRVRPPLSRGGLLRRPGGDCTAAGQDRSGWLAAGRRGLAGRAARAAGISRRCVVAMVTRGGGRSWKRGAEVEPWRR